MYDFDKRTLELQNSLKPAGENNKVKTEEVIPAGSVAELDKLITEARKKYAAAITNDARVSALKLIQELEQKKIVLNITAKYNSREQMCIRDRYNTYLEVKPASNGTIY